MAVGECTHVEWTTYTKILCLRLSGASLASPTIKLASTGSATKYDRGYLLYTHDGSYINFLKVQSSEKSSNKVVSHCLPS